MSTTDFKNVSQKAFVIDEVIEDITDLKNETERALLWLEFNDAVVLTGSRLFETDGPGSDYDFFIDYEELSIEERGNLLNMGFEENWISLYSSDESIHTVFGFNGLIKIHLQVIKHDWFESKVFAQNRIQEYFSLFEGEMRRKSKIEMGLLWKRLMRDHKYGIML